MIKLIFYKGIWRSILVAVFLFTIGRVVAQEDSARTVASTFEFSMCGYLSKPHMQLDYGRIDNLKPTLRSSWYAGFSYCKALKRNSGLVFSADYGLLRTFYSFNNVYPDTIAPDFLTEDFVMTKHDVLQFAVMFRKNVALENHFTANFDLGLNEQLMLSARDFVTAGFVNGYYYNPRPYLVTDNTIFFGLPGIKASAGLSFLKKDLDLVSLSLVGNIGFDKMYTTELRNFPDTPFESKMRINYKGSYFGLKLSYLIQRK